MGDLVGTPKSGDYTLSTAAIWRIVNGLAKSTEHPSIAATDFADTHFCLHVPVEEDMIPGCVSSGSRGASFGPVAARPSLLSGPGYL